MVRVERLAAALQFVEEIGLLFQEFGYPQMTGRVLGWLLLSEPPLQTMDELAAVLQASKGSISTATRLLIRLGVVERVALPGQRRDHFRVRPGAWNTLNRAQVPRLTALRELAERGLDVLAGAPAAETSRLTEMRDIFAWLERELPMLMDRYDEGRAGGLSEGAT